MALDPIFRNQLLLAKQSFQEPGWQSKAFKSQETWGRQVKVSLLLINSHFWFSSEDTQNHHRRPLSPTSQWLGDHYSHRGVTLEGGQCSLKATLHIWLCAQMDLEWQQVLRTGPDRGKTSVSLHLHIWKMDTEIHTFSLEFLWQLK